MSSIYLDPDQTSILENPQPKPTEAPAEKPATSNVTNQIVDPPYVDEDPDLRADGIDEEGADLDEYFKNQRIDDDEDLDDLWPHDDNHDDDGFPDDEEYTEDDLGDWLID